MTASWTIAGHTLGTPDLTVLDAMRLFAAAELDAAELIWQDGYQSGIPESENRSLLRQIRELSSELTLPVVGLTPYMTGINSVEEDVRERDIDRFRRCIGDAAALGAAIVRVYAGEYTHGQADDRTATWAYLVESLRTLAPFAQDCGVTLAVENHFNTMTMTAAETVELVKAVDHPAVGILYDQANLTFTHSEDHQTALELQRGHIRHVHVKDFVFNDRDRPFTATAVTNVSGEERAVRSTIVGEGELPWDEILPALAAQGYTAAVSLEYEYRWHRIDLAPPLEGFRRGAESLRRVLTSDPIPKEGTPS